MATPSGAFTTMGMPPSLVMLLEEVVAVMLLEEAEALTPQQTPERHL